MRTTTSLRGTNIKRKQQPRLIIFSNFFQPVLGKKQFPGQRHLQNWGLDVNWAEIECNCCKSSFLWNCEGILMKIYILSFEFRIVIYNTRPWPPFGWDHGAFIPDNCRRRGRRRQCKFFLAGVNFYRFNAKNWHFRQISRQKVAFYTDLTRKIGVFRCKFYSPKILPV